MKTKEYSAAAECIFAAVIGTLTGIITLIGQKYLPDDLNFLANSASMWLIPAFFLPYCFRGNKKRSVLFGMIVLIFCVQGYYIFEAGFNHHAYVIGRNQWFWLCCAVIGGMVFGLCGNLARTRTDIIRDFSMNILPAVFAAEASSKLFHINDYRHMVYGVLLQMTIGLVLYAVINRKSMLKKRNIFTFIVLLIFGSAAFEIMRRIL